MQKVRGVVQKTSDAGESPLSEAAPGLLMGTVLGREATSLPGCVSRLRLRERLRAERSEGPRGRAERALTRAEAAGGQGQQHHAHQLDSHPCSAAL